MLASVITYIIKYDSIWEGEQMRDNRVKGPAMAAFIIQIVLVCSAVFIIQNQIFLRRIFFGQDSELKLIPIAFWYEMIRLIFIGIMFVAVIAGNVKNKRLMAALLVIFLVLVSCTSVPISRLVQMRIHSKGMEYLNAYVAVSALLNYPIALFSNLAIPLFFIACGRYGSDKDYKVLGLIALIFQVIVVGVTGGVVLKQGAIGIIFGLPEEVAENVVFPVECIFPVIVLAVFILFYILCQKNTAGNRKDLGILFTVIIIGLTYLSMIARVINTVIVGRTMGTAELAKLSSLSNALAMFTSVFSAIATAFFFVAVGRFGISSKESVL